MASSAKLPTRPLGKDGPQVPRIGLGMVNLTGGVYGQSGTHEDSLAFLDEVYERGETFWDTADEYGQCEDVLGKWFAANPEKREDIFLATKFAVRFKGGGERGPKAFYADSTSEYCKQAIERSLTRLGLPYVDLYYIHRLDKITPIEKTMEAMVELKKAGKIKHIGLSECSADSIRRAHNIHPVACVQVEYSPFCTAIESSTIDVLKAARELGIAIVAYSPLGNGFITGTIRTREDFSKPGDMRGVLPWLKGDNLERNVAIVDKLSEVAKSKGITTAQLCLAWLLAQGDDVFPIPSTTKIHRLEENLGCLSVKLSPEEEGVIRQLSEAVVGGRVQEMSGYAFADTPAL